MLHTPAQSPIVNFGAPPTTNSSNNNSRPPSSTHSRSDSQNIPISNINNNNINSRGTSAYTTTTTNTSASNKSKTQKPTSSARNTQQHQHQQTPLHVDDVGVSIRLMKSLESIKQQTPQQEVRQRSWRNALRPETQTTRDDHWKKRMESVRAATEKKKTENHKKTQMHQLFKHYCHEQRMSSRSNTPSVAASTAAAVTGTAPPGSILFPTTANSLTKQQVDEYFAVPSFVRPLLSTFSKKSTSSSAAAQQSMMKS